MKIVQINAVYGSKSTGTIVRDIQLCCEAHGAECYIAYSETNKSYDSNPKCYRIGNKLTAKWAALVSRIIGKQAYANHLSTWCFLRWLDIVHPDVVHLHNLHSNYIHLNMLLRYLAERDIATVITMHDCWFFTGGCTHYTTAGCQRWKTGCGNCPQKKALPSWFFDTSASVLADRKKYLSAIPRLTVVGASLWVAEEMKQSLLGNLNITYIHNGFDLDVFTPTESTLRHDLGIEDKFVILGPADKWLLPINKPTLDYFISHMTADIVLVLFGCSNIVDTLPKNIVQIGYIKDPREMAKLYSMADVMANCSREDTLSSLNLECQACGTPVVTYDATGNKETVDGRCGFAIPTGNAQVLYNKVVEIQKMWKEKLSQECREWIVGEYNKKKAYVKYLDMYHSMI